MPWIADGYVAIGKTHLTCQDYVLANTAKPAIVVCDGCSSSKHTDLGARLLAHSAHRALLATAPDVDRQSFGDAVIKAAHNALQALNPSLDASTLDATLLVARLDKGLLRVLVYGDGIVAALRRDGRLEISRFCANHGAPCYLSYRLDPGRAERYQREYGAPASLGGNKHDAHTIIADNGGSLIELDAARYQAVLLSTDGLETFVDTADGAALNYSKIVHSLLRFKLRKGAFLRRRAKRELKNLAGQGIAHHDDMGVAALLNS